jgi:nicotinate phosphoribosyltransferase
MRQPSLALATDLYELTMAAAYFENDLDHLASFEVFVRWMPPARSYLVAAGLGQVVGYLTELRFTDCELEFLRRLPVFRHISDRFFSYLSTFRFTGDVWAMPEGTIFFPNEPLLRITAPIIEAQVLETYILSFLNFESSIASKAARIVDVADGRSVIEFGGRRAHGMDAALFAARAAYIGGCVGTSNVEAGYRFGIPLYGTAAHSWNMAFDSELESFRAYLRVFPETTTLLIDTYDTIAGAHTATQLGPDIKGVRLDSGDLAELSQQVRSILDAAGMHETKIVASGDLDEYKIQALLKQDAPIDLFGVGTQLTTSYDAPTLGGVYKLVEEHVGERIIHKMKLSTEKSHYPGCKQVWRQVDADGRFCGDIIGLADEVTPADSFPLLAMLIEHGRLVTPYPTHWRVSFACLSATGD